MARKRNGLVTAGEASGSLGGPVKAIHSASPQARHHFTQADQVNQLVSASEVGPRSWLHGAVDSVVCITPNQSRQPERIQARQRPLPALHAGGAGN